MDEGFLGFDTQRRLRKDSQTIRMGVGELAGYGLLNVHPLTSSADRGDFSLQVARTQNVMVGGADPVLLVVKKNKSILANVTKWATTLRQVEDPVTGRKVVRDVPCSSSTTRPITRRSTPRRRGRRCRATRTGRLRRSGLEGERPDPGAARRLREEGLRGVHRHPIRQHP